MLTLYHYWSSVCSQKARMCLAEKQIAWQSRHVDIFAFKNYSDWYTWLNPKNVVPTLDHDGRIIIESNVILEYLDEAYRENPLRPDDPYESAMMRLWVYNSEEMAHWNVNVCSHNLRHAKRMEQRYSKDQPHRGAGAPRDDRRRTPAARRRLVAARPGAAGIPGGVRVQEPGPERSGEAVARVPAKACPGLDPGWAPVRR